MPSVGFEPTFSAGERPQTYDLDHTATGIELAHLPYDNIQENHSLDITNPENSVNVFIQFRIFDGTGATLFGEMQYRRVSFVFEVL
jgi:hypothetical protein